MASTNILYTRTTWGDNYAWNEIIEKVNDLCVDPPDGCDPLDTLEEVPEEHIWTKEDVTEVHDKLKEMCEERTFTDLLGDQLWTSTIIDEIVDALTSGWCGCEESPVLDTYSLGIWTVGIALGKTEPNCGGRIVEGSIFGRYTGWDECQYIATCYDPQRYESQNEDFIEIIEVTFQEALDAIILWAGNRRNELLQQDIVERLSIELIGKRAQLESLQNQLAACQSSGGDCSGIQSEINDVEEEIEELEEDIQTAKDERDGYKDDAIQNLSDADTAAIENWETQQRIRHFDPAAINIVADHIAGISEPWGLTEEPPYLNYRWSTWGVGASWTYWSIGISRPVTNNAMWGKFTPSGLPFSKSPPMIFGTDWRYDYRCRHRCGIWDSWAGLCTFGDWTDWGEPTQYVSGIRRHVESDELELIYGQVPGTVPHPEYEPNPDQEV